MVVVVVVDATVTANHLHNKETLAVAATEQPIVQDTEYKAVAETTAGVAAVAPIQYTGQAAAAALV